MQIPTAQIETLEPELERGRPSAYLHRKGDAYMLSLGDAGWSDIEAFKKMLEQAKEKKPDRAITHYEKAVALYKGDLFEEDPYCNWCFDAREDLKEKYLRALTALIAFYGEKGVYQTAIGYAVQYLHAEKYDEAIYQLLMQFYAHIGNRSMINKSFEQCQRALEEGLDCQPNAATQSLYRQLMATS